MAPMHEKNRRWSDEMTRLLVPLIILAGVSTAFAQSGSDLGVTQAKPRKVAVDEVQIQQETGQLHPKPKPADPANAGKSAPEGTTPTPAGSTSPNTCDSKNASSQACYTATQQGRAK
jgi:hypothetical protein